MEEKEADKEQQNIKPENKSRLSGQQSQKRQRPTDTIPLRKYFPILRSREEILSDIRKNWRLSQMFNGWKEEQRTEFLDICTGIRGLKITYDPFFKEVMNPEYTPERLSSFLSVMLGQKVKVLKILPNDSVRITAESTLLITDIVVELADGSIVNVEMQKIGYLFPGERAACYSADLLLRQYKRIKGKKDKVNYRDIKPVYTIILFEKSPKEFHAFPKDYLHHMETASDTGIQLNLLQNYLFIPLDIFCESRHNKSITSETEAWLTFFSSDEPEDVIRLIEAYPAFKPMYEDIYKLCENTERVMDMFSEELYELDKNTVKFMMDEMQEEIDGLKEQNSGLKEQNSGLKEQNSGLLDQIIEKDDLIEEKKEMIEELRKRLARYEN